MWHLLAMIKPREGWFVTLLLTSATLSLSLAVHQAGWADGTAFLIPLSLAALHLGRWLGVSRLSRWMSIIVGGMVGIGWVVSAVAGIVPPLAVLASDWAELATSLGEVAARQAPARAPFAASQAHLLREVSALAVEVGRWFEAGLNGGEHGGQEMFLLLVAVGIWAASSIAGWELVRTRRAMVALTPLGLAMSLNSAFALQPGFALSFLACVVLLLIQGHYLGLSAAWDKRRIDYSPEIRLDMTLHSTWIAAAVVIAAWSFPFIASARTAELLWRPIAGPWQRMTARVAPLFREVRTAGAAGGGLRASFGDLPLSRLLGGPPELRNEVVMVVSTRDVSPGDMLSLAPQEWDSQHSPYWRGLTYDRYTGHGWENSMTRDRRLRANQPLEPGQISGHRLEQRYQLLAPTGQVRYAVHRPLSFDQAATISEREGDDLVAVQSSATRYAVLSQMPRTSEAQLRKSATRYPAHIRDRYLQLPEVPTRVSRLAEDVVSGATTPYDRARALEAYLRAMPYDLEVPLPPSNQDVVDYFLFDLRRGYCDYFASAMVVMARSVGLPARLATGYGTGRYDPARGQYVVVGLNALPGPWSISPNPDGSSSSQRPPLPCTPGRTTCLRTLRQRRHCWIEWSDPAGQARLPGAVQRLCFWLRGRCGWPSRRGLPRVCRSAPRAHLPR